MSAYDTSRPTHAAAGFMMGPISHLFAAFAGWNDARRTRNSLSRLTDRELEDIGLARGDIDAVIDGRWTR
ncbi:MAG: primosomal protein DnaI [Rhodobacteraceae bacterium]|nr:primosomal protein DnaI [Paracoccaceae bacterium]